MLTDMQYAIGLVGRLLLLPSGLPRMAKLTMLSINVSQSHSIKSPLHMHQQSPKHNAWLHLKLTLWL